MKVKRGSPISGTTPPISLSAANISPLFAGCKLDELPAIDEEPVAIASPAEATAPPANVIALPAPNPKAPAPVAMDDRGIWLEHLMVTKQIREQCGAIKTASYCVRCQKFMVVDDQAPAAQKPPAWNPCRTEYTNPPGVFHRWSRMRNGELEVSMDHPRSRFVVPCWMRGRV